MSTLSSVQPEIELLIFQATSFCNIDCSYCYLPNRSSKSRIDPVVVSSTAQKVMDAGWHGDRLTVVWHAGEPLSVGPAHLRELFDACAPLRIKHLSHSVQTNATLISEQFCDLFIEKNIRVGVSLDGPRDLHDRYRVRRNGSGTFDATMAGIHMLRDRGIPFNIISVLTYESLARAEELYEFFASTGAESVGFNVDELEGVNHTTTMHREGYFEALAQFWDSSFRIHFEKKALQLREADALVEAIRRGPAINANNQQTRPFSIVTVSLDGSIGTFSPELLGQNNTRYGDFSIGNVLSDDLNDLWHNKRFLEMNSEITAGIQNCSGACDYFDICGGGAPSNKMSEHGRFDATETNYCRAIKKTVVNSMIKIGNLYRAIETVKSQLNTLSTIEGVLSDDNCAEIIEQVTSGRFASIEWERSSAPWNDPPARSVKRISIDLDKVFDKIRDSLPKVVGNLALKGLASSNLICIRYFPGESFGSHKDYPYIDPDGSQSLYSLLIYLNDEFEGGETYCFDPNQSISPLTGAALILPHGVHHEASKVTSGAKYLIHTYVMYQ